MPAADRTLADGTPLVTLRWDRIEQEHYVPATMVRLVTLVEVMGTADTHEMVVRAPVPAAIVQRSKYTDALLIEMMVRKYMRGQPFYRVLQDMRAMGSDLSDSTLSDLAQRMASFLDPVVLSIRSQVLREAVAHIDETPLPTHDGSRYLWAFLAGNQVFFHVGGRGGNELRMILGLPLDKPTSGEQARAAAQPPGPRWQFVHIMADGYTVYTSVLAEAGIGRLLCWAHALRAFKPFTTDPRIETILKAIGKLYAVEEQAAKEVEAKELDGPEGIAVYARLRAAKSQPQLTEIKTLLTAAQPEYGEGTGPAGGHRLRAAPMAAIRCVCAAGRSTN